MPEELIQSPPPYGILIALLIPCLLVYIFYRVEKHYEKKDKKDGYPRAYKNEVEKKLHIDFDNEWWPDRSIS